MADDLVSGRSVAEFFVTVLALLIGFVVAKYISKGLATLHVPIASGDPVPLALPGAVQVPWRRAA